MNYNVLCCTEVTYRCPAGRFGVKCSGTCHCFAGTDVCRSEDGRCTDGVCQPGWTDPPYCQTGTMLSFLYLISVHTSFLNCYSDSYRRNLSFYVSVFFNNYHAFFSVPHCSL